MRVRLTPRFRRHLASIHDYIASRNPQAATRVIARIKFTVRMLGQFPLMGHKGQLPNTREMNVRGLPYIIVYRIERGEKDLVAILAVFHGARDRLSID